MKLGGFVGWDLREHSKNRRNEPQSNQGPEALAWKRIMQKTYLLLYAKDNNKSTFILMLKESSLWSILSPRCHERFRKGKVLYVGRAITWPDSM